MRCRTERIAVGLSAAVFLGPGFGRAQPTLEIRARTNVEVIAARDANSIRAIVTVTDDVGMPRSGAAVAISAVPCTARTCRTDGTGRCSVRFEGCAATRVRAETGDQGAFDRAEASIPVAERGGAPRVEFSLGDHGTVDLESEEVALTVQITGESPVTVVAIRDELGRAIGQRSGRLGEQTIVLAPDRLGPPGLGAVELAVSFEDGTSARAHRMIERRAATRIALTRRNDSLVVRLATRRELLEGRVVTLVVDGRETRSARTDSRGVARFTVPEGGGETRALFAGLPGFAPSTSAPVRLPRTRRFVGLVAFAPLLTLPLAAVAYALARRRRTRTDAGPAPAHVRPPSVELRARVGLVPRDATIALRVLRAEDDTPMGATVVCHTAGGDHAFVALADVGSYSLDVPVPGPCTVSVNAEDRMEVRFSASSPHRGNFRDVLVRLETPRAHARRAVALVAEAAAREGEAPLLLSVREADARLPAATDTTLVLDTEDAVYGAVDPEPALARVLVDRAEARVRDVDGVAPVPPSVPSGRSP